MNTDNSIVADILSTSPALMLEPDLGYVPGQTWSASGQATVLIRTHYLGICRSDAKEVIGNREGLSHFGHEIVGDIVCAHDGLGLAKGDFVGIDPNVPVQRSSGYSGYFAMSADMGTLRQAVHKLPISAPDRDFIYVEPLACAIHAVEQAHQTLAGLAGKSILVLGAGVAGMLIALACMERGSQRPTIANRSALRINWARDVGLDDYFDTQCLGTLSGTFDAVFIATSFIVDDLIDIAGTHTNPGGAIVLYGGTESGQTYGGGIEIDKIRRSGGAYAHTFPNGVRVNLVGSYGTECTNYRKSIQIVKHSERAKSVVRKLTQDIISPTAAARQLVDMSHQGLPGKTIIDMSEWLRETRTGLPVDDF